MSNYNVSDTGNDVEIGYDQDGHPATATFGDGKRGVIVTDECRLIHGRTGSGKSDGSQAMRDMLKATREDDDQERSQS